MSTLDPALGALFLWTFQLRLYYLLMDLSWVPGRLQSCGLRGTLLGGSVLVLSRIGDDRAMCPSCTAVLDRCVWMLTSPEVTGNVFPVVPAGGSPLAGAVNPAGPDGPVVAGGPIGPCETPSPSFYGNLDPLEHLVLDYAGPDGRHVAVGPVGPFRTLSSSDCHPAGPAGPYVAGGPVGPDVSFEVRAFGSGPY